MGKAEKAQRLERPGLAGLLAHPILRSDNGPPPKNWGSLSGNEHDRNSQDSEDNDNYEGWLVDHSGAARFFLGGFDALKRATGQRDAKHFFAFVEAALEIAESEGWQNEPGDCWQRPASYNQFRKAILSEEPMFFDLAAQVLVSCECALDREVERGRYNGHRLDVYKMMKIVPACYNINGFNVQALAVLRQEIINYDVSVLTAAGQVSSHLLMLIASGNCVTRRTARAIRWKTLELLRGRDKLDIDIGDVRGRPGKKRLGCKNATKIEKIELENLDVHVN